MPDHTSSATPNVGTASAAGPAATSGGEPTPLEPVTAPTAADRYVLGEEIARGGMGAVYRAADTALGREVAVKVLLDKFAPDSGTAGRFHDEARITGQLQHPGIPPVHDLGTLPDGRPFLAMKLIKGDTLDALLAARSDPAADRGRFVAVFEQVCQGVAYAHAHDVIHRDLKPANVMVGAFGEVQVMDWGLAKVMTDRPDDGPDDGATAAATAVVSLRESDGSFTQAGSVLGTPAFMPPEQAIGAVQKVGPRSDVFGLGAVLAVILTGKPPFAAGSGETTRVRAATGDVAECFTRLEGCGADPELVALCKRCLSPRPEDRPADAGEVAKAVAALRAAAEDRALQAELDRVKAEGEAVAAVLKAAEQRKRRRVQAALGLAFTALVVLGGTFAWWQDRQAAGREAERKARQSRTAAVVAANLREARERAAEAWTLFDFPDRMQAATDAALAAVGRAEQFAAEGGATEEAATDLNAARAEVDDLARHTRLMVEVNRDRNEFTVALDSAWLIDQFRTTLQQFGFDPLTDPEEEIARRIESSRIRDGLLGVLLEMSYHIQHVPASRRGEYERLTVVARAVRFHLGGSYAKWQDLLDRKDQAGLVAFSRTPEPLRFRAWLLARLGTDLVDTREYEAKRNFQRAAVARYPHDVWLRWDLVYSCLHTNPPALHEALHHAAAAVTLQPGIPRMYLLLGDVYRRVGDPDGVTACYGEAIRLYREAIRSDPKNVWVRFHLGTTLVAKGHLDDAVAAFLNAIQIDPKHAAAGNALAWILAAGPDWVRDAKQALEHATRACGLANWKTPEFIDTLAAAHAAAGDFDKAVEYQKQALAFPGLKKTFGPEMRERLDLYTRKKPYYDPALAPRVVPPPPRDVKR